MKPWNENTCQDTMKQNMSAFVHSQGNESVRLRVFLILGKIVSN